MVWVGSQNDLPLVHSGIQQAEGLASALLQANTKPKAIYCSHLRRAVDYAQIVTDKLGISIPIVIDNRLNELDYGQWSGLEDAEIIEKFGKEDFDSWRQSGVWPQSGAWGSSEAAIIDQVDSFLKDVVRKHPSDEAVLAITSNGRLRYFFKEIVNQVHNSLETKEHKVGTGRLCILEKTESGSASAAASADLFDIRCWNEKPEVAMLSL